MKSTFTLLCSAATVVVMAGCAGTKPTTAPTAAPAEPAKPTQAAKPAPSANAQPNTKEVKSRDGKYTGEVSGTPVAGSKFSKLVIGMEAQEVQEVLGRAPDRSHSYESGKRWIPFYFGNDARRTQALYKGEGCLIFTGGNVWGGGGGDLIGINHDATGACYQP